VLGQDWKANLIRWQIQRNWGKPGTDRDLAEYDRWIDSKLDELDKVLESCRKHGIRLVIDLHTPPGGRSENNDLAIFHERKYQDHFVDLWEKIARRYKGHAAVWGYDLVNEPVQNEPPPEGLGDYLGAQARASKAIRAIDPNTPIFIEADQWDSADGFAYLNPVDVPNVVYQVHMYWPHQFTHQGVSGSPIGLSYPGEIAGQKVDEQALRRHLQPVRDFQLAYNVHIYVGEFSAIRWAPGESASRYLRDCIELFEEYGWDWSYHAYREWDGWSVEHGSDPKDSHTTTQPTGRKNLLLEWFAKNRKPSS
jgi:endoglucanase